MEKREYFSSRWLLLITILGMAIGTGNIWRFPRIVAQNGGGTFLIPWLIFLFSWSIPLIIVEFSLGKHTRKGVVGTFSTLMGKQYTWIGAFVAFVTIAIMFYYSVVTGWCFKYFLLSVTGALNHLNHPGAVDLFRSNSSSWSAVGFHVVAMVFGGAIVLRGITSGIERANRVLIPSLLVILVISAVRAVTLPGGTAGLEFFFKPDWSALLNHGVWLEALSQSAWSTGAGWGLILTYAVYMRKKDDIVLNSFLSGLGNNSASLLCGIVIFGAVFALTPAGIVPEEILQSSGRASTGLTFEWIPVLFNTLPGKIVLMPLFFLALSFAAISSLISMLELGTRVFMDFGLTRKRAIGFVCTASVVFGLPSALYIDFFNNQDWVWGVGLIMSGFFFAFSVIRYGVDRFRRELVNTEKGDIHVGKWFNVVITVLIPAQFLALVLWWFYKSTTWDVEWWNPLHTYSIGTCVVQWGIAVLLFRIFSVKLGELSERGSV